MSVDTTTQSSFTVQCDTNGLAATCSQNSLINYYVDSLLIGQTSTSTPLTLDQFQTIIALLTPAP